MKKTGFTLIELIATIGLLGMLATITITVSVRKINEVKEKSRDTMYKSIEAAAKNYILDNGNEIQEFKLNDNTYVTLQTLVEKEYFTESLIDPTTKKSLPLTNEVYITREVSGVINASYNINQKEEPKLKLVGGYNIYLKKGNAYQELGANAINQNKEDISSSIVSTGTVDINSEGKYVITYSINNTKITRNVIIYK